MKLGVGVCAAEVCPLVKVVLARGTAADPKLAVLLALDIPAGGTQFDPASAGGGALRGRIWINLADTVGRCAVQAEFQPVAHLPTLGDFRLALKTDARLGEVVVDHVSIFFEAVVPGRNRLVDLTGDHQTYLAVALPRGCRFQFRDPLFQVGTAIAREIGCGSGSAANHRQSAQSKNAASQAIHAKSIFIITPRSRPATAVAERRPIMSAA